MNKFKVGDVAMYKDKLVHIVVVQKTNTKHTNLFGENETEYRYLIEDDRDNLQTLVREYELVEIKNQSSYLIIPRKDNTDSIDGTPANLSLKDMAEHLIKILVDNIQPDPEVLAEAIWDLFMPVPFPSVEEVEEPEEPDS